MFCHIFPITSLEKPQLYKWPGIYPETIMSMHNVCELWQKCDGSYSFLHDNLLKKRIFFVIVPTNTLCSMACGEIPLLSCKRQIRDQILWQNRVSVSMWLMHTGSLAHGGENFHAIPIIYIYTHTHILLDNRIMWFLIINSA